MCREVEINLSGYSAECELAAPDQVSKSLKVTLISVPTDRCHSATIQAYMLAKLQILMILLHVEDISASTV